jgi:hypothetical protein
MPRSKKTDWIYIAIPEQLAKMVDEIVEADKYPMGKWQSRNTYVTEKLKPFVNEDHTYMLLDKEIHSKLATIAKERGITVHELIRAVIIPEWLREKKG